MDWGDEAVIGFNGAGDYYDNYNISDDAPASRIACLALPEETNNIVYDLVPNPSQLQCESATPAPPTSLGESPNHTIYVCAKASDFTRLSCT